jgi:lambda family phage portal protein
VTGALIDRIIGAIDPVRGLRRKTARRMLEATAYRAADQTRLRGDWILPGLFDETSVDPYELDVIRARTRDHNRNDPVAAGATDTMRLNIVGQGLKPQSRIRADYIGISEDTARQLQRQAESAWQRFGPTASSDNRLDMDELQFLAITKIIEDGEVIAVPAWANETWRPFGRVIEVLESERLGTPFGKSQIENIHQGIELGSRGQVVRYWVKKTGAKGQSADDYRSISAFDGDGRPMVLHIFRTNRPGQLRGIPLFAPVLTYFKDLASYLEAEVVAARVAACLAVFITKTDPMAAAYGMQTSTESTTGARITGIEPGMVGYLGQGEGVNVVDPKRPGETFQPFVEQMLRIIGASIGLPYELIAKDFSKTNYSSARAALLEGRRQFLNWRGWFARKFCQPIWGLVLEEAYLKGEFEAPHFYDFKDEYCRCQWIGGAWGWVDPVKEVEASRKAVDYGLSTLAEEAAGQGRDWEEVLDQRGREIEREKELGIGQTPAPAPQQGQGDQEDAETEQE